MTTLIACVRLLDIGPFVDVTVPFPRSRRGPDVGQVLAVAGSGGKTTFLRALALALAPLAAIDGYHGAGVSTARSLEPSAKVRVDLAGGTVAECTIHRDVNGSELAHNVSRPDGTFVAAYGPHRNAPDQHQSEVDSRVSTRDGGFLTGTAWDSIASLFGDRRLCSVWDVLSNLHRYKLLRARDFRDIPPVRVADMQAAYGAVTAALSVAVGVRVQLGERDVLVDGEPLKLAGDGVRGQLRWVTDMLARWIDREWRAGRLVGEHFAREMRGVCLVDALDEGLSSNRQESAFRALKRVFPGVTFVASVYNKPAARGLPHDELVVFEAADDGCGVGIDVRERTGAHGSEWNW